VVKASESLARYLNDHLAGSVAALELLSHLIAEREGSADEAVLTGLRSDIEASRAALESVMAQLDVGTSPPRQAAAWLMGKLGELKLRLDDPADGALRRLEGLETLGLGVEGQQSLWRALAAAALAGVALPDLDYAALARRAGEQRETVEALRLRAAREVIMTVPDS
jgi:hypothetical protein